MSTFKRTVLFSASLALIILTLTFMDSANSTRFNFNLIVGSVVAIYNFLHIYKKATTTHVIIDSEAINKKIEELEREDKYV